MTLSFSTLIVMAVAIAAVGVWHSGVRAREAANRIATDACRRRALQFLDGTVALARMRPRLGAAGLSVERTYVFDYTGGGVARASGFIIMQGLDVQHVGFESERRG